MKTEPGDMLSDMNETAQSENYTKQNPEAVWFAYSNPVQPDWTQMISFCDSLPIVTAEVWYKTEQLLYGALSG